MKHEPQTQFGRPKRAVLENIAAGPDKWRMLQLLTEVADDFDLSHRTLGVLKALLTFLPTRTIPDGPGAVVFPANKTLSHRLSGMPESTLRRHLAALIKAGIVSRQDSPNCKRYARMRRGAVALAFGFDLSPLAQMQNDLTARAQITCEKNETLALLRTQVMRLRAQVIEQVGQGDLSDEALRVLRRKPDAETLEEMASRLSAALADAAEMSACVDQNERHIHTEPNMETRKTEADQNFDRLHISDVTERYKAYQDYFPEKITRWSQIIEVGEKIAPMLGIENTVMRGAQRTLGLEMTSIVVLSILERLAQIECPTAYLGDLVRSGKDGHLRVGDLLCSKNRKLSADNPISAMKSM